ncbi:MAG: hypothetical protein AAGH15_08740 [Myxococcota bacterium]
MELAERLAIVTQDRGGMGGTAVTLVDRRSPPEQLDLSESLTFGGFGDAFGSPFEQDVFFTWSGEAPRLTRYRASLEGGFTEEGILAFDRQLVSPPGSLVASDFFVVAPDKAYVLDGLGAAVVIFDPQAMTLVDRVLLPPDLPVPGFQLGPVVASDRLMIGDTLVVTIGFTNSARADISATSFIVFLDTTDDTIERVLTPESCGYLQHARATASGTLLFGTGVRSAAFEIASAGEVGGPSCILEVDGTTFDATPLAAPGALTGGRAAGSFYFVSDTSAFVRIFEESALDVDVADLTRFEVASGPYWRWGFVPDLNGADFRLVDDGSELRSGFSLSRVVDDVRFAIELRPDFGGSRLIELQAGGTILPLTETSQFLRNVFGMRL